MKPASEDILMKPASTALAALINSGVFECWDIYSFALWNGQTITLTTADFDIDARTLGGAIASSKGPYVDQKQSKTQAHWKIGLDSDQWQVVITPNVFDPFTGAMTYPDKIGTIPWLQACRAGLFDNAQVTISRAYFADPPVRPLPPNGAVPVGLVTIFLGVMGTVDTNNAVSVFTINDYKTLLSMTMPRNLYQATCRHVLFDQFCTLNAALFAQTGVLSAGSTQGILLASPPAPSGGSSIPGASQGGGAWFGGPGLSGDGPGGGNFTAGGGTYQLGRVVMTSGSNQGFSRTIQTWDGADTFTLQYPLPFAVAAGDGVTMYPGCDKLLATCTGFNNAVNFGGQPFIPPPEVVLG